MKQLAQNLRSGEVELTEIPCPAVKPGHLLIRTAYSLLSSGTERMLMEFGQANLLSKAAQQPDKVRMVLDKLRTDGILPTVNAVWNKLDQPLPLGYCNVGVITEIGSGVNGFEVGDLVASNGSHAEFVCVPLNLCAKVPAGVPTESAAFTVISAIALQGIRLAQPTMGEAIVVMGLGLVGLITVQLLQANGCRVLGIDVDERRLKIAQRFGAATVKATSKEEILAATHAFSRGRGVDGVLIAASTTSNDPVSQAAQMCRKRGRIILVGVTGLELSRDDFYEKELTFQVSCSYGPGRYDEQYEQQGRDYPVGFVRWTEQRNLEAVLDLIASNRIDVAPLISHRFPYASYQDAYRLLGGAEPSLGILLDYETEDDGPTLATTPQQSVRLASGPRHADGPSIAFIGAGNYAGQVLMPAFRKAGARLKTVASAGGVSGTHLGKKIGFEESTTDTTAILDDQDVEAVVIATRHNTHAAQVCEALRAGKHVFVEKPLAVNRDQLEEVVQAYEGSSALLMVGFNRRFAPHVVKMKSLLDTVEEPKSYIVTVNAGAIPSDHWTQDSEVGGGRIIGEACHFIDLLRYLTNSPISGIQSTTMRGVASLEPSDKVSFTLSFDDGSIGTVHYLSNGNRSFPKERIEVFAGGRVLQLDNFRRLRGWGWSGFSSMRLLRQDKGNATCAKSFVDSLKSSSSTPIPFEEVVEVTRISIEVAESATP